MNAVKFPLGQVVYTPNALEKVKIIPILASLRRHIRGDWGVVSEADKKANDVALTDGGRLFSAYLTREGTKFWIITEADRSATTVLMPDDY